MYKIEENLRVSEIRKKGACLLTERRRPWLWKDAGVASRQAGRQAEGQLREGRTLNHGTRGRGCGGRGGLEGWISAGVYGGISGWSRTMWGILSHIKYGRHRGTMVKTIVSSRGRGRFFFYPVSSRAAMIYISSSFLRFIVTLSSLGSPRSVTHISPVSSQLFSARWTKWCYRRVIAGTHV